MILEFEEDKVNLFFEIDAEGAVAYHVNIYAKDKSNNGSRKKIHTSERYLLAGNDNHYWIVMDYMFYNKVAKIVATSGKPLPNKIEFFFEIEVELQCEDECTTEKEELSDTLTLHFVRYVPKLMNILGFSNGERLQRIWFNNGNNIDMNSVAPELKAVSLSWLMSESSTAKRDYQDFKSRTWSHLNNNYFITGTPIRDALKSEINKMLKDSIVTLPTKGNPTPFGVTDIQLVTYKGEKMPKFEKYYFNSEAFNNKPGEFFDMAQHYALDGLDDFVAAIGSFKFHVIAIGELEYKEGLFSDSININIQKLGFYAKDNYDFTREKEPLGFWKIVNKNTVEINRDPSNKEGYYEIENKSYREYRDDHNMGYNYHLYSDIHYENVNLNVTLKNV